MPLTGIVAGFAIAALQTQAKAGPSEPDTGVELILLDVLYDHLRLDSSMSALQDAKGKRFLPLRQVGKALGFRIKVVPQRHTVTGFLVDAEDRVTLDGYAGTWTRKGRSVRFDPALCFERDNDLYLDAEILSRMTGIHFEWRLARLELNVSSDDPLPIRQQWMQRRLLDAQKAPERRLDLPVVRTPYSFFTPPSLDVHWYSDARVDDKATDTASRLQIEGQGDLLFLSARYRYISASADRPAATLLTLGRQDPRASLLGGFHATQFSLGDVTLPQLPLFARTRSGLGVTISNFPLGGMQNGLPLQVEGRAPAGSIVELYRASELLATVRADAAGQFVFSSLALESGPNELRIVSIAPDGDVQEETRTLYGDASGPPPGKGQYRVSAVGVGQSIFPNGVTGISDERRRLEYIGEYRWGLASGSWLALTAADAHDSGGDTQYAGLGFHSWSGGNLWHLETMLSGNGGTALSAGLSRKLGNASISLEQTFASPRFGTQVVPEIGLDATSITRLRLDGTAGSKRHPVAYGFSVDHYNGADPTTVLRARMAGGDGTTYVANTVTARVGNGPVDASGLLQIRRQFGRTLGRFDVGYGFGSAPSIQTARLSLDHRVSGDYRMRYGLDYDGARLGKFESTAALYRLFGPFELGVNLAVDARGVLKANLLLSVGLASDEAFHGMALARPGATEMGSVAVRIYMDRNYNGKLDEGDVLLPNIGVKLGGRTAIARSGTDGVCFVDRLASNQEVTLTLNEESFEDPCWTSSAPGVLVIPRSGRVARLDLGVIEAAEIEGKVQGTASPSLSALLFDYVGKLAHTSVLDENGTYAFSHVRPGDYTLRIVDPAGQVSGERLVRVAPAAMMRECNVQIGVPKSAKVGG